jgi:hypothetical protein
VEECAAFRLGANDDQVDAMTQALERLPARTTPATITIATGRIRDHDAFFAARGY